MLEAPSRHLTVTYTCKSISVVLKALSNNLRVFAALSHHSRPISVLSPINEPANCSLRRNRHASRAISDFLNTSFFEISSLYITNVYLKAILFHHPTLDLQDSLIPHTKSSTLSHHGTSSTTCPQQSRHLISVIHVYQLTSLSEPIHAEIHSIVCSERGYTAPYVPSTTFRRTHDQLFT
jgi:hypothetical protein